MTFPLRPELEPLPPRMQHLPVDARGYVVPWFVQWLDGVPEFRVMDREKWVMAIRDHLCWVCGSKLGRFKTFVVGPMCGVNRTTAEPPAHRECAEWSARNCPFLARPQMTRRGHEQLIAEGAGVVGGEAILRNPGVTLLWTTTAFEVWRPKPGEYLIEMGIPTDVQWFAQGRRATLAEVEASVQSGLPALQRLAEEQDRDEGGDTARQALARMVREFEASYYPQETT